MKEQITRLIQLAKQTSESNYNLRQQLADSAIQLAQVAAQDIAQDAQILQFKTQAEALQISLENVTTERQKLQDDLEDVEAFIGGFAPLPLDSDTSNEIVSLVQEKLNDLGYDIGMTGNLNDAATQTAILQFQVYNEIPDTGIIDAQTALKLGLKLLATASL